MAIDKIEEQIRTIERFLEAMLMLFALMLSFWVSIAWDSSNQINSIALSETTLLNSFKNVVNSPIDETPKNVFGNFDCNANKRTFNLGDHNASSDFICESFGIKPNDFDSKIGDSLYNYLYFEKYKAIYLRGLANDFTEKLTQFKKMLDAGNPPNRVDDAFNAKEEARNKYNNEELKMNDFENKFKENINSKLFLKKQMEVALTLFGAWLSIFLAIMVLYTWRDWKIPFLEYLKKIK